MTRKVISLGLIFIFAFACTPTVPEEDEKKEIKIVYTDWAESIGMTYLAQVLLERHLDYDVILKLTEVDGAFKEIANGESDAFLNAWIPATHKEYLELYKNRFEDLGPNYKSAKTGLVVPTYMKQENINDLKQTYVEPIAGIDSASGIMQHTRRAIDAYKLENELLVLSDAEMTEKLINAIKRRGSIVVTGWEPHWLFYRYDLKYLDDPEKVYMEVEQIHTIARKGFSEDHPRAVRFFERMVLSEKQINALLYEIHIKEDPLEGVKEWIKNNKFTVNQWTRDLSTRREKIM